MDLDQLAAGVRDALAVRDRARRAALFRPVPRRRADAQFVATVRDLAVGYAAALVVREAQAAGPPPERAERAAKPRTPRAASPAKAGSSQRRTAPRKEGG
jgi:hypothetical protein